MPEAIAPTDEPGRPHRGQGGATRPGWIGPSRAVAPIRANAAADAPLKREGTRLGTTCGGADLGTWLT